MAAVVLLRRSRTVARPVSLVLWHRAMSSPAPSTATQASTKWSDHQAEREKQMKGFRFVSTDLTAQPLPTPAIDLISNIKIIEVASREAVCDGGGGPLGHPKVYINLDHETGVCKYCGLQFRQAHSHDDVDPASLQHTIHKH